MSEPPTRPEIRFAAYVLGLCALILISTLSYGIVHRVGQGDAALRTAVAEADQVQRLNAELDAQSKAATAERSALMAQNRILQLEVNASARSQRAVLRYLRNHGIQVPLNVITPLSARSVSSNRPKVSRPQPHPKGPVIPGPRPGTPSILAEFCALLPVPVPMFCP